jgi:hypothetical protein
MQSILKFSWSRLLLLLAPATISILIIGQLANSGWDPGFSLPQPLEDVIFKTSPPPEVAIDLTDAQLAELEEAFKQGFENPEPNDPCKRLQFLAYKKLSKWRKQFRKRGFTMEKIKDMLVNGKREAFTHPQKGVTFTKIYDNRGNWIVVDFVDCIVYQVAPYNFY